MKREKVFEFLNAIAEDTEPVGAARIAAAIVIKNRVVSIGTNKMKSHPFQKKFGKNKDSIFIHAEIAAIKNAIRKVAVEDLKRSTLYVARVKKKKTDDGNYKFVPGEACPCNGCKRAIVEFGIRHVIFSRDSGEHGIL